MGKFQTGKAMVGSKHRRPCHGNPRHHPNAVSGQQLHAAKAVLQADDHPPAPLVRCQNVGSCAQDNAGDVQFFGHFQDMCQFLRILRKRHHLRRAANAKRGMAAHGFFKTEFYFRQKMPHFFLKRV